MRFYLSLVFLLSAHCVFAQKSTSSNDYDSLKIFRYEGKRHTLELKGLVIYFPIGNGHVISSIAGLGVHVLKRHHIGFDYSYVTHFDESDDITDTLGVRHQEGAGQFNSKSNVYGFYYHYHFDLFGATKKSGINFFVGAYYKHFNEFSHYDPLYNQEYLSQRSIGYGYGLSTGVAYPIVEVRGLRVEGGFGYGNIISNDDTKYRENGAILYKKEKKSSNEVRIELGLYWTFL